MTVTIRIEDQEVLAALQALMDAGTHLEPAFRDIGEYMVDSTKRRFGEGISPDGDPWAPNSPVTLSRKSDPRPLHGESGRLENEIYPHVFADGVEIGSPLIYAAVQQFGAAKHAFGVSPWGDIPARPFLGLSDSDRMNVLDILQEHLTAATR
ncbi:phage virion morphogenesis protein [Acidihalobacter prosperus]|uniref:Phage virion morphogenesis protein n=1 Tax=Acidihalobacter prosperus TaxID=160660 RepID=A0A1A6C8C1_9GAMM|nr:phage virion morphogenesis protein [Acidihalobacter prosperus]OBS10794.1 hypothetical protein Thpro_020510 [Acidihalobacter prosperus]